VDKVIKKPMLTKVKSMVNDILSQDKTGHGFDHIQRVLDLSMSFAKSQPVDEELVSLIALLHDVDDYKFVGVEHAILYKNARSIMHTCGVHDSLQTKVISNIQEIRARGAKVIAIAEAGDTAVAEFAEHVVYVPQCENIFSAILTVIPLQVFAMELSTAKGLDVDQPRNLAKSVTVE
jgi:hypothetical protein